MEKGGRGRGRRGGRWGGGSETEGVEKVNRGQGSV